MIGYKLLYAILNEQNIQIFNQLTENIFTNPELDLYRLIRSYLEKNDRLPTLRALSEILEEDLIVPEASAESLFEQIRIRYFMDDLSKISKQIDKLLSNQEIQEVLSVLKEFIVRHSFDSQKDVYLLEDLKNIVREYLNKKRNNYEGITGVTTGWPTSDRLTNGFQPGDLIVVVARPKKGKSLILAYMACQAHENGEKVMLISMEMGVLQQAKRIFALKNHLNYQRLQDGTLSSFTEEIIFRDTFDNNFIYVDGQFKKSVADIEALLIQYRPDVLYIDGGYLMTFHSKFKSLWENTSEIAKELKLCAMRYKIPIIVSFQFNRQIPKKDSPGLEHIQLSDAIGQLASVVLTIAEEENSKERTIELLANREGLTDAFKINWDWETMNFEELEGI